MPSASRGNEDEEPRDRTRRPRRRQDDSRERTRQHRSIEEPDEHISSPSKARPKKKRPSDRPHSGSRHARPPDSEHSKTTSSNSTALSSTQLAALDKLNQDLGWSEYDNLRPGPREREAAAEREGRAGADAEYERRRAAKVRAREKRREEERERRREEDRERRREEARERRKEEQRQQRRRRREEEQLAEEQDGVSEDETRGLAAEGARIERERHRNRERDRDTRRRVSGRQLEHGSSIDYNEKDYAKTEYRRHDGGSSDADWDDTERKRKLRRNIFIGVGILIVLLLIIIPVAVVVSKKHANTSESGDGGASGSSKPANSELNGMSESDLPKDVQGTYLDPFTWYDTTDFNVTYTSATVGGLSIMGLNDAWDDSKQANANVPPLNQPFSYGSAKIHGVNLGGWLSIEPFITPSLFSGWSTHDNVVDEYTLTQALGASKAKTTLEQHYSSFVQESTFADIQKAGFDHIRIPFSYWAVTTYDGDPYVPQVSWRYLLRGIEWARKYGLRINLDLHAAPGSQNGWNHSGRQGYIGWLNGTDGTLNGQRTIDIHKQLSAFFTQPRYVNIITMYGLVNEPRMVSLNPSTVMQWTQNAYNAVRANNYTGIIIFGDGFMGLDNWKGQLQGNKNLLLDVHQYVIFNTQQIVLNHHDKINFACGGWTAQALRSSNPSTGFGPTLCGEWSQADTDCAQYLNNVGIGSRWEGTLNMASTPGGSADGSVLNPTCPTKNNPRCSCENANADPASYSSEYKQWLLMFAEAQMFSFEQGWGWFYWTWQTETATQWSYKAGLAAGILPKLTYQRDFNCSGDIPQFASLGLPEFY